MINNQPFQECYKILNVTDKNNWNEVRKAYKKLIQKWHPDKFTENTQKREAADEKIKQINSAYNQLNTYYKQYGELPRVENNCVTYDDINDHQTHSDKTTNKQTQKTETPFNRTQSKAPIKPRKGKNTILFIILILSVICFSYIYEDNESHNQYQKTKQKTLGDSNNKRQIYKNNDFILQNNSNNNEQTNNDPQINETKEKLFFTYGSTIGDVIMAQGVPTKNDGDTWYYGNSQVFFRNGKVVSWYRDKKNPLNVKIKTN